MRRIRPDVARRRPPGPPQPDAATRISGTGDAIVTDENDVSYVARVVLDADVSTDAGSGTFDITFDDAFSATWGAEPGIEAIHLRGNVTRLIRAGGILILSGTAVETDRATGRPDLVFTDEAFDLIVTGPRSFTITWCKLPAFDFEMMGSPILHSTQVRAAERAPPATLRTSSAGQVTATGQCPR